MPIIASGLSKTDPDKLFVLIGLIAPTQFKEGVDDEVANAYWSHCVTNHEAMYWQKPFAGLGDVHTTCVFAPLDKDNNLENKAEVISTLTMFPMFVPPITWNKWSDIEHNVLPLGVTIH